MSEGAKERDNLVPFRPNRDCPECGSPARGQAYPFCSRRCADLDLNRWLSGSYAIAGEPAGEAGSAPANSEADGGDREEP